MRLRHISAATMTREISSCIWWSSISFSNDFEFSCRRMWNSWWFLRFSTDECVCSLYSDMVIIDSHKNINSIQLLSFDEDLGISGYCYRSRCYASTTVIFSNLMYTIDMFFFLFIFFLVITISHFFYYSLSKSQIHSLVKQNVDFSSNFRRKRSLCRRHHCICLYYVNKNLRLFVI